MENESGQDASTEEPTNTEESGADEEQEETTVDEETAADPEASPREVLAAIVVLFVMVGGITYAYFQGLDTGKKIGSDEVYEQLEKDGRLLPVALARARPVGGIRVEDDQEIHVVINGPADRVQDQLIDVSPGDRFAVFVAPPKNP